MRKWYVSFLAFRFKHRQALNKCLSSNILNNNVQSTTKKKDKRKEDKKIYGPKSFIHFHSYQILRRH